MLKDLNIWTELICFIYCVITEKEDIRVILCSSLKTDMNKNKDYH